MQSLYDNSTGLCTVLPISSLRRSVRRTRHTNHANPFQRLAMYACLVSTSQCEPSTDEKLHQPVPRTERVGHASVKALPC